MKLISLEIGQGTAFGIIETPTEYKKFSVNVNGDIGWDASYPRKEYGDYKRFAAIIGKFDPYMFIFVEPEEIEKLTYEELVKVQLRRDEKYGKTGGTKMLGMEELKHKIGITDTTVDCPVKCCSEKVQRQRRGDSMTENRFKCPNHNIWISPSTFGYEKEEDNLLWKDEQDLALLGKIMGTKRESRMAHERSEDAVTWNIFRFLEKNSLIDGLLTSITKIPQSSAEIIYWSYSQKEGGEWSFLKKARVEFGEKSRGGSEPDIIIQSDKALFFIEAKLTAGNKTTPSNKKNSKKYETGGNACFREVFESDYQTIAISEKKYELMRLWLLGTWISEQEGVNFYLINLVPEAKEKGIESRFWKLIKETPKRKFMRQTWEGIYRYIESKGGTPDKQVIAGYFKNKTVGYKKGFLQRAFSL